MSTTLFERIGGSVAVEQAVDIFYRKVLKDPALMPFFELTDMGRQIARQRSFLTMVFGGPNNYDGRKLRDAHMHLVKAGMGESHFESVMNYLIETLRELGVAEADVEEVRGIAMSVHDDVLNL